MSSASGADLIGWLLRQIASGLISFTAYNVCVNPRRQNGSAGKPRRHAAYATETSGLLLIAFLLLVLILVGYWHAIHWSWR
jgi:hypothetical protein